MSLIFLRIGIIALPFYEILIRFLPYSSAHTPDTRIGKIFIGMWFALAVGLFATLEGSLKKCRNVWLIAFILFIPLSIHLAPQSTFAINGIKSVNYWNYKPFLHILAYFFMFLAVQSMDVSRETLKKLFHTMVWCGFIMAIYMILQNFGWDQFFIMKETAPFLAVTQRGVVGTLGQSTIVSPFVAMTIPMALYLRRWFATIALVVAVCLSQSSMAIGGMIVMLIVFSFFKWPYKAVASLIVATVLITISIPIINKIPPGVISKITSASGRLPVWKESIRILKEGQIGKSKSPTQAYTGYGPGSYAVMIRSSIKTTFDKVHSDPIQVAIEYGIIGFFIFICAFWNIVKNAYYSAFRHNKGEIATLLSSFVGIIAISCGSFILQLSPHIFYTIIIVGLLSNESILTKEME